MKKFLAAIKRSPKRSASILMVAAAIIVPGVLFAWGSDRPTFTMDSPATHVTFNSITDNPKHGDERNFVQIKEATAPNSSYGEDVALEPGKDYDVFVLYHNDASTTLNDDAHGNVGIAKNTTMRVQMPAGVNAGQKARITAVVGADNAQPLTVWDEAYGSAAGDYALRYVPGSATIYNNGATNGQKLPDSLYTTGTQIGYDKLDGNLPGCAQYSGYVVFKVHVDQPNFTVEKQVSLDGKNAFSEEVTAKPGDIVDYKIQYKNTGTVKQENISIRDTLPAGVEYVPGTTMIATSATNGKWTSTIDNVTTNGIGLGSYLPGGNAYVSFKAKIVDNDKLAKCGLNTLVNTATAQTANGNKSDTANVIVSKDCAPAPIYTCDNLSATKIDRTNFAFTGKATAKNGATIVSYTFDFGDGTSATVSNPANVKHTYAKNGTFSVKLSVTFKVNGSNVTTTGANCVTKVIVEKPPVVNIQVCDLTTKKVITIDEKDFDSKKHSKDLNDCKPPVVVKIQVCELATKTVITINEKDFDAKKHSKNLSDCAVVDKIQVCELATNKIISINEKDFDSKKHSKNLEDCKAPVTITVCELDTKKTITINEKDFDAAKHSKDLNSCATATPPVTELPTTGAGSDILTMIGAGSLIAALGYYVASRRTL